MGLPPEDIAALSATLQRASDAGFGSSEEDMQDAAAFEGRMQKQMVA